MARELLAQNPDFLPTLSILAREALNRVSPRDRDSAAFHVVSGWLACAEGNFAEQKEQVAAAVRTEPKSDLYQFDLAALQIYPEEKNLLDEAKARLIVASATPPPAEPSASRVPIAPSPTNSHGCSQH
jgi:hypothetical protein